MGAQPYWQDERMGITLYCADCRDVLSGLAPESVDLILTDPPYGIAYSGSQRAVPFGVMAGDDGNLPVLDILASALKVLRQHRHIYVFGLRDFGVLPVSGTAELVWDKGLLGMGNLAVPWSQTHEMILFGVYVPSRSERGHGDGRLTARLRRGSVLRCARLNSAAVVNHPTEKPVPILREMIESSSLLGETVLDPFVGCGSTLVASLIEGRKGIGIEIEERYCEIAVRRLMQLPLSQEMTS